MTSLGLPVYPIAFILYPLSFHPSSLIPHPLQNNLISLHPQLFSYKQKTRNVGGSGKLGMMGRGFISDRSVAAQVAGCHGGEMFGIIEHIVNRIYGHTVDSDFIVQMGSRGATRRADHS